MQVNTWYACPASSKAEEWSVLIEGHGIRLYIPCKGMAEAQALVKSLIHNAKDMEWA